MAGIELIDRNELHIRATNVYGEPRSYIIYIKTLFALVLRNPLPYCSKQYTCTLASAYYCKQASKNK